LANSVGLSFRPPRGPLLFLLWVPLLPLRSHVTLPPDLHQLYGSSFSPRPHFRFPSLPFPTKRFCGVPKLQPRSPEYVPFLLVFGACRVRNPRKVRRFSSYLFSISFSKTPLFKGTGPAYISFLPLRLRSVFTFLEKYPSFLLPPLKPLPPFLFF